MKQKTLEIPIIYPFILYLLSISWLWWYKPYLWNFDGSVYSFFLQQGSIFASYGFLDSKIKKEKVRQAMAGVVAIYLGLVLFDSMLLSITSITIRDCLHMLYGGQYFFNTLEGAKITFFHLLLLPTGMFLFFFGGILVYSIVPRSKITTRWFKVLLSLVLACFLLTFTIEQYARKNTCFYMNRQYILPMYLQFFSKNQYSFTVKIKKARSIMDREKEIKKIQIAKNPKNVIFFLLESFRKDHINKTYTPNLYRLQKEGVNFTRGYTCANFSPMVWNTLLFDRPCYKTAYNLVDQETSKFGSWPLAILQKAGYNVCFATSTDLSWMDFDKRIVEKGIYKGTYISFPPHRHKINKFDNQATQKAIQWLEKTKKSKKPFFLMLQLNSTHWNYYFDKDAIVEKTYSNNIFPFNVKKEEVQLYHNRYLNSTRHVDNKIGEVLSKLKEMKLLENMVIIVISDHGESFASTGLGHSSLDKTITEIPIIFKFPKVAPHKRNHLIAPRHIFPTLFDYLQIAGITKKTMLGKSLLHIKNASEQSILTIHGTRNLAKLQLQNKTVRYATHFRDHEIVFTPIRITLANGGEKDPSKFERELDVWKKKIEKLISPISMK